MENSGAHAALHREDPCLRVEPLCLGAEMQMELKTCSGGAPANEAKLLMGRIPALHREDPCSPQGGSMLSTGRIPALHREHLWLPHSNVCSVDVPQRLQKPLNAELDVYKGKSQNDA